MDKPKCKLSGKDGNVFSIIGEVCQSLRRNKQADKATEFANKAMKECVNYDQVLALCFDYVNVQ